MIRQLKNLDEAKIKFRDIKALTIIFVNLSLKIPSAKDPEIWDIVFNTFKSKINAENLDKQSIMVITQALYMNLDRLNLDFSYYFIDSILYKMLLKASSDHTFRQKNRVSTRDVSLAYFAITIHLQN
jgi:hypothetical protein